MTINVYPGKNKEGEDQLKNIIAAMIKNIANIKILCYGKLKIFIFAILLLR